MERRRWRNIAITPTTSGALTAKRHPNPSLSHPLRRNLSEYPVRLFPAPHSL